MPALVPILDALEADGESYETLGDLMLAIKRRHAAVPAVAESVAQIRAKEAEDLASSAGSAVSRKMLWDEDMVLCDLMNAPRKSKLFSLASTLARIENLSFVLCWTLKVGCLCPMADIVTPCAFVI